MALLTIGAFAGLSGLTPKALRLYDDLGLLPPARVDPGSGYRYYDQAQLAEARMVAWLRRLGMPLARIRQLCGLTPAAAAAGIAAYWAECEADHAMRRDLAGTLISELSGEATGMTPAEELQIRCTAGTDAGLVRARNEDAAYAGTRLLAVADGFGTGGGGDLASAAAVSALAALDAGGDPAGGPLAALRDAARQANDALPALVAADPSVAGLRHHPHRPAVVRRPARRGAHRRLPRLPPARRGAVPDHPRPQLRAAAAGRGPAAAR